ncbi:MAG: GcrA family cell cycle regulator [Amaricoccus sp.]
MSWTDERVETLKSMWSEGKSASQIAKELGGVTRNAVRPTRLAKAQADQAAAREQAPGRQGRPGAAAWRKHTEEVQEQMGMPAVGYDRQAIIGGDANPPTASHIPGMQCTGTGDDASCDALSSY